MVRDISHIQPYAHIFFCRRLIKDPNGVQVSIEGQFRSLLLKPTHTLELPDLIVGVQLVVAKSAPLHSIRLLVTWRAQILHNTVVSSEQLSDLIKSKDYSDPNALRHVFYMDARLEGFEATEDGDLVAEVLLNEEPLNHQILRIRFKLNETVDSSVSELVGNGGTTPRKRPSPAIPVVLLAPSIKHDADALFAIASAYADAALLVSSHGHSHDRVTFTFPAIVCSSFAIELLLKFFIILSQHGNAPDTGPYPTGHSISQLWDKVEPAYQRVIAGMYRNESGQPIFACENLRMEKFKSALREIGRSPFIKWRYPYELSQPSMMSHAAVAEVVDALGHAAQYVRNHKWESSKNTPNDM